MVHEIKSIGVALDERMYFNNEGGKKEKGGTTEGG